MEVTRGFAITRDNKVSLYKGIDNIDEVIYDCGNSIFKVEEQHGNARLAMQAFNLYNDIGLTPNECYNKLESIRIL